MDRTRIILIFGLLGGLFWPSSSWARVWPVTLELLAGTAGAPVVGSPSAHRRTINIAAAAANANALAGNSATLPTITLFPVVQGQQPQFVVQAPHTGKNFDWKYSPPNMVDTGVPGIPDTAFHCGRGRAPQTPSLVYDIRQQGGNWVVEIFCDLTNGQNLSAAFWQARQPAAFTWLIDDGAGGPGLAGPSRATLANRVTFRTRFNKRTGRIELVKNGVFTPYGFKPVPRAKGNLNRRFFLRRYR